MVRGLLRLLLIIVIVVALGAFFIGYRWASSDEAASVDRPVGTSGDAIDTSRARETGAEVLAISNDGRPDAQRMAEALGHSMVVLSDPSMRVIYRYGMKGERMPMADMGYVVIDRTGVVRARTIDRRFGEHADAIVKVLRDSALATTGTE